MHIIAVGLNHHTAPVDIRERFAFDEETLPQALQTLRETKSIFECVILSTCNRTELYVVADQIHTGRHFTKSFLAEWFDMDADAFAPFLFINENQDAVSHLFKVTCGLDSMVLGETQILGQVRDSFALAQRSNTTGTFFNELFKEAITLGKRVHAETEINDNPVSTSYAAVELAKQIFGDFQDKHLLIMGAGKMSELTAKHMTSNGHLQLTVMNRTIENAKELAVRFNGTGTTFVQKSGYLESADIIISSTGARDYVLRHEEVERAAKKRKGRPLFIVDIAVPRDVEPSVHDIEGVFLYDIDDLEGIVHANLADRKETAIEIEGMIDKQMVIFQQWMDMLGVVPVMTALRQKALKIQSETMDSIERKLPQLSEREKKVLNKHTKSIINQMLREPIQKMKEMAAQPNRDEMLEMFIDVFGIEEEMTKEKTDQHSDNLSGKSQVETSQHGKRLNALSYQEEF